MLTILIILATLADSTDNGDTIVQQDTGTPTP
jgi:hypothetical protein